MIKNYNKVENKIFHETMKKYNLSLHATAKYHYYHVKTRGNKLSIVLGIIEIKTGNHYLLKEILYKEELLVKRKRISPIRD